ncbi:MAG TPA: ATP-binding protein [Kofleriaceae bacterium]|jgi:nitrogen fixation/metabolism regulation signal transduction histidine kinase|nr:ATP-binding protein [Kofleriaceae bacterium]
MKRASGIGLEWKLVIALLVIVTIPLGVSYVLIDQSKASIVNVASNEAALSVVAMEKSLDAYRELFETTKRLHGEIADRLSKRPELVALDPKSDLAALLGDGLRGIAMLRDDGSVVREASRPLDDPARFRDLVVDQPLPTHGTLRLTFTVPATLQDDYQNVNAAITKAKLIERVRTEELPSDYRTAFLILMGLAALAAAAIGLFASQIITKPIAALVTTARRVSDGQVDARAELTGKNEMAELGAAFNTMLDDLAQSRSQIEYLQRIGAWQDVARRLAHEIKNPLTPIQLAVQQTVSQYKGDDARFAKTLKETGEIVEEEIAGLRRLVDTFRTLGQLPKVEKHPVALADVMHELELDPAFAAKLSLVPPAAPVTVRADKLLLKRVLANLVENGIHAGGSVVVTWVAGGDGVTITVDDRGKGVAEADRDKIFEPYVTTKATGTGLGLAISRKIAIEHGGELELALNKAPTGGARFVVTLPTSV